MLFWITIRMSFRNLLANKLRSLLSMLGIIIGVGAVIALMAIGAGAQRYVVGQISSLGSNLIMVNPGQSRTGGAFGGQVQSLIVEDAEALLSRIPEIKGASCVAQGSGQLKYYGANKESTLMGVQPSYLSIRNFEIASGRVFTESEDNCRSKVAVLGADTATDLFGDAPPVGETIKINGRGFKVIGVLEAKGSQGPFSFDDQVLIPLHTAMRSMLGVRHLSEIDMQLQEGAKQDQVQAKIEGVLRHRHRIAKPEDDDFVVRNMAEMVETVTTVTRVFSLFLGAVAAISLVVGGIGIMNIMLVTVTERTREIGIRKAIGAQERDILAQFLVESIIMSVLGGLIGIAAGVSVAKLVALATGFVPVIEAQSIILALSFATGVGIFFGLYPARRASTLDPIEALSYE